ncbi:PhnE/PtxC family ABC transporter permease [Bacillus sp. T3]|uniref:PhnE/PtxC family ABC transporter permease n=1 Tax=Bacillus sp. T3 TaxID=467262 RepID=UPI0029829225|nr:ABC transporter permease subunit [Bacillus sp. T3]
MKKKRKMTFLSFSIYLFFLLIAASWYFIIGVEKASLVDLFSGENVQYASKFFKGLIGIGEDDIAFLNRESWSDAAKLTIETLKMSIMAIGFSTIVMFLTVIPAARNMADGTLTLSRKWYHWFIFGMIRVTYLFSRSVPELVWAMIIIFIFKPGILPGAIALALHNFGILGKLCAEVIEDMDSRPIRNLASAGAGRAQILMYGVLPSVLPQFLTYILYRWEVIMRTTIVVGFVGAGGLGQQFKLSMSFFHYTEITLMLICYIILVVFADFISDKSRFFVK